MINMKVIKNENVIEIINNEGKSLFIENLNTLTLRIYFKKCPTDLIELKENKGKSPLTYDFNEGLTEVKIGKFKLFINNSFTIQLYKNDSFVTEITLNKPFSEYDKKEYSEVALICNDQDKVFGLGDKMGYLDKKGYWYKSWNTDDSNHQDELFPSLYKSINYLLFNIKGTFFSMFFPSTFPYTFDICKTDINKVTCNSFDTEHDFYLFLGDTIKEITSSYSYLCGHPYFVRLKMLGYQQSRWSYENETMVRDLMDNFKKNDLPLDYIHLDIHYMDGYRDYTIDKSRFPNMKALSYELKKDGVELVLINDAAIKKDEEFKIYQDLVRKDKFAKLDNKTYINTVWPGESAFPNYLDKDVRKYFNEIAYKFIHEYGISGIWNDMNEPASFNGELPLDVDLSIKNRKISHKEAHNIYGENMVKDLVKVFHKDNLRPYLFSRAAFATTSKYAFVWNGDNFSLWHHLRYSLTQNLSLSLSNFMFNGVDISGFGGDSNKELSLRWLEANLFMPFLRNHSSLHTKNQEPYAFDEETLNTYRKYLDIRYKFIPYLYDLTYRMNKSGELIVRPLFYNYEHDKVALNINDEYMVGDSLLVAPILNKDEKYRVVYLPKGTWIDYFTHKEYKGENRYIFDYNLLETGYFIKKNSIIPMFENLKHINKEEIDTLVIEVFGKSGKYTLYEDDGTTLDYKKGIYNTYKIEVSKGEFSFHAIYQKYNSPFKHLKIKYLNRVYELDFNYHIVFKLEEN